MKIDDRSMSKAEIRNYWGIIPTLGKQKNSKEKIADNLKWVFCEIFDRF